MTAPNGEDGHVDLAQAADRLGVHYQTAYRWVRSGRLPAAKVDGRYTVSVAALERLRAERAEPESPPRRTPRRGFGPMADRMFDLLVDGDENRVRRTVGDLVGDGVPLSMVAQDVIVPALRRIGEEWFAGRLTIPTEHRASAIVERVLGEHLPSPRGRRRGTAVVAALSGDRHVLPTTFAAVALREDNWKVHHLGADVPAEEIVRFCTDHDVDLAVLTVTSPEAGVDAQQTALRLERIGLRALVGEPGGSLAELTEAARRPRQPAAT